MPQHKIEQPAGKYFVGKKYHLFKVNQEAVVFVLFYQLTYNFFIFIDSYFFIRNFHAITLINFSNFILRSIALI